MSEQFEQSEDDELNIQWECPEEADLRFLVNDIEVHEVDGTVYMDLRCIDPVQMERVASTGQAGEPQQGAVKGRLIRRIAMSPGLANNLLQQLREAEAEVFRTEDNGCAGENQKSELQ